MNTDIRKHINLLNEYEYRNDIFYYTDIETDQEKTIKGNFAKFLNYLYSYLQADGYMHGMTNAELKYVDKLFEPNMQTLYGGILYRGLALNDISDLDKESDFISKKRVKFKYYLPTTEKKHIGEKFANINCDQPVRIFFELHLKHGCKYIDIADFEKYLHDNNDMIYLSECEILLQRNTVWEVMDVNDDESEDDFDFYRVKLKQV